MGDIGKPLRIIEVGGPEIVEPSEASAVPVEASGVPVEPDAAVRAPRPAVR
jgi:hypothetical protein